ncbi:hypothetical protein LHYA1_G000214 [Lachnellula hyalina]|uniref:Cation/H+ exchanger transmembrane domain-containing protein n=1 Tax=Lachnellula hyalina TaxID=1316788 RepID=A0A8H8R993_9HELO|nr:uncharacterized protein LHYA1_G000214 [Lachnellula hyalina]TVY30980.1 hypothetical protein LHYA1_G000214 [Lachnellula hyalina]
MASEPTSFLPYHEPQITTILIQSALLLALNITNTIFDKLIFCGLLAQVFIGVAWGTPGSKWLDRRGLNTNFHALKLNLTLSVLVAITGISLPIALSFILHSSLLNATPLQAFAAGAALCSTSLGTTFTILGSSGLAATRLGVVLSSAAMMDDVVGLVMVQVISNLGGGGAAKEGFRGVTVVRPVAVSVGFAVTVPLVCRFVVVPLTVLVNGARRDGVVGKVCSATYTPFIIHTMVLLGLVTGASYAGTSNLFTAYLAGAAVSWRDSEIEHSGPTTGLVLPEPASSALEQSNSVSGIELTRSPARTERRGSGPESKETGRGAVRDGQHESSGIAVYEKYYATVVQRILKPFFFASIGFSIPITDMFNSEIVWRGIVYTILMLFAKLVTGMWLIRLDISWSEVHIPKYIRSTVTAPALCFWWMYGKPKKEVKNGSSTTANVESHEMRTRGNKDKSKDATTPLKAGISTPADPATSSTPIPSSPKIKKPLSLYPAAMLGTAMTARGEIGFLIASLAETTGLFASSPQQSSGSSEIYLVVTWAIVLCTIIGPLGVGMLVRRVRRLQNGRESNLGVNGPLGIWGVG